MTDINFIIPISGYSGLPVNDIVEALLSGSTTHDVCMAFQEKSVDYDGFTEAREGFLYDYLSGLLQRFPDLLESVNKLRLENGKAPI